MKKLRILLPDAVSGIIRTLQKAGYEAWAVGGCVRDSVLGRTPDDWDITTSATPGQVKALFARTVDTGIRHGTVTVWMGRTGYEVTTYRIDGIYEDGRHPKEVTFTASLKEDLKRRDFTINAMAYNEESGLVDLFGGIEDIRKKMLCCVGDPRERFSEDALRMMRAVRFSAQLDYVIAPETKQAIKSLSHTLDKISAERIQAEFSKLLVSGHPERIRVCYETGLTRVFFPEFDRMMETGQNNPHHLYSVGEHTIRALSRIPNDRVLRLAVLLHDAGKPQTLSRDANGIDHFHGHAAVSAKIAETFLRRLKYDNDTIRKVVRLVRAHDVRIEPGTENMRRALNRLGADLFPGLFALKEADLRAQSDYKRKEKEEQLSRMRADYEKVMACGDCFCLKDLAVGGADLIALGFRPGKEMGEILQALLEQVLEDPARNTREELLKTALQISPFSVT